jgi:hypothetical protein
MVGAGLGGGPVWGNLTDVIGAVPCACRESVLRILDKNLRRKPLCFKIKLWYDLLQEQELRKSISSK